MFVEKIKMYNRKFFGVLMLGLFAFSSCAPSGKIDMTKSEDGQTLTFVLTNFSSSKAFQNEYLAMHELSIDVAREKGTIGLSIVDTNGNEPYVGSHVLDGTFTVVIHEHANYTIEVTGNNATATISIIDLGETNPIS
ncbi:MAG: hypothetical protein GXY27_04965 [Erysipelotrichaceae bacterium]|nr:hypothetical protein [Erysipelotrichaceae bacterium]